MFDDKNKDNDTRPQGTEPEQPEEPEKTGETRKPEEPEQTGEPEMTEESGKTGEPDQTEEAGKTEDTDKPEEPEQAGEPETAEESGKAGEPEQTEEAGKTETGAQENEPEADAGKKGRKRKNKPDQPKQHRTGAKQGSFLAGMTAIAIVIVIAVNLIVGQLPTSVLQPDISGNDLYRISDTTKEIVNGLTSDVEIIVLSTEDSTDSRVVTFLSKYEALSDHISVEYVDPVANPSILTEYDTTTGQVVITCPDTGKTTTVALMGWDGLEEGIINYDYYTYYQSYASSGTGTYEEVSFDAEGQITSAVNYVTSDQADAIVYTITGHGETDLPSIITSDFSKNFLELNTDLDLLTNEGGIPDDCDLLIDFAPTTDLSDDELTMLEDYLRSGGNLILLVMDNTLTNYNQLMSDYGMVINEGESVYVADSSKYYAQYASYYGELCFNPTLSSSSDITKDLYGKNAMVIYAYGITEGTAYSDTVSLDTFMTTSSSATLFGSEGTIGDAQTYILGTVAVDEIDDSTTSRFTVITSPYLISESILSNYSSFANSDIFMNAVTANFEGIETISIESISLGTTYLTIPGAFVMSIIFVGVVPAAIIVYGVVHYVKRRRK